MSKAPTWADIHMATTLKNVERLGALLAEGADVNARDTLSQTALHKAAFDGSDSVIEFLLQHGADIDAEDALGQTPEKMAEISGRTKVFKDALKRYHASIAPKKTKKKKAEAA